MAKWLILLAVLVGVASLHATARDMPKEAPLSTRPKDGSKEATSGAKDDKHFVAFAGVGGYGGVGGVVGVVPLDKVLGGGLGGGTGLGGGSGRGGGSGLGGLGGLGGGGGAGGGGGVGGGNGCTGGLGGSSGGGLVPLL
ncbi:hypothetical protein Ancab_030839 [Ancistrocladus abbreviatus]